MPEVARAKRPSSASLADIATTPTVTQPRPSCGGGTHRICASRVGISGPLTCELEEGSRLPKIPVLQDGEDVNSTPLREEALQHVAHPHGGRIAGPNPALPQGHTEHAAGLDDRRD